MQQALIDRLSGKKELPLPCAASEAFGKIVLRMCAHDPGERYQNAGEILADLEHITGSGKNIAGTAVQKREQVRPVKAWMRPEPCLERICLSMMRRR